jgi:hypothetical protein
LCHWLQNRLLCHWLQNLLFCHGLLHLLLCVIIGYKNLLLCHWLKNEQAEFGAQGSTKSLLQLYLEPQTVQTLASTKKDPTVPHPPTDEGGGSWRVRG